MVADPGGVDPNPDSTFTPKTGSGSDHQEKTGSDRRKNTWIRIRKPN